MLNNIFAEGLQMKIDGARDKGSPNKLDSPCRNRLTGTMSDGIINFFHSFVVDDSNLYCKIY
jgi:hypothetical protein